jgi:hypothetical protein
MSLELWLLSEATFVLRDLVNQHFESVRIVRRVEEQGNLEELSIGLEELSIGLEELCSDLEELWALASSINEEKPEMSGSGDLGRSWAGAGGGEIWRSGEELGWSWAGAGGGLDGRKVTKSVRK